MSVAQLPLQPRTPFVSIADRVLALQAEARAMAKEHVADFERALAETAALAEEISGGGDAYPVGVREIARRLAPELDGIRLNLESLRARAA